MSETAIRFEKISKQYRLGTIGTGTLSHDLKRWWTINVRGKEDPYLIIGTENTQNKKDNGDYILALSDINLEVKKGEVLGIIGKNGAGKSTLLKILSRVTSPTTGIIKANGRIASLLEVGTGFHPEMTGRENVFMNGSIMGMTKGEIKRKFDEIVSFAGVERYIDTPVKRYSSGMTVRLGFAVAAHLEPEILVVDEVLAVGDAEFQKKALGKMQDVSRYDGKTVLFVSHNMAAVKSLCSSGVVLENGRIVFRDTSSHAIDYYLNKTRALSSAVVYDNIEEAPGNENIRIKSLKITPFKGNVLNIDSGVRFSLIFFNYKEKIDLDATFELLTHDQVVVFHSGCLVTKEKESKRGYYEVEGHLPPFILNAGAFKVNLIFGESQRYLLLRIDEIISFEIENTPTGKGSNMANFPGIIFPIIDWKSSFEPSIE